MAVHTGRSDVNSAGDVREELPNVEPGLWAARPVTQLSPPDRRCCHAYYTSSPLSADGTLLTYFRVDHSHVDRDSGKPAISAIGNRIRPTCSRSRATSI